MPWIDSNISPPANGYYLVKVQMSDWPDVVMEDVDEFKNGRWRGYAQFVNEWWEEEKT